MDEQDAGEIRIVPVAEGHVEGFHRALDAVARERLYLASVVAFPIEQVREFILSNIQGDVPQFVALCGDELVGWCDICPVKYEGMTHCGRLGMGVLREFRHRGIGQDLLERTIAAAGQRGIERVELDVFASNTAAVKLYQKLGFVVEGVKKQARKLDGVTDDMVVMALFV